MELGEFAKRIRQHGENVVTNANLLKRRVALAVDTSVVLATPVDVGRARSNWQVGVGEVPSGTVDAYAPGKGGNTGSENAAAAIEQGKAAIGTSQPAQDIHIVNNLPYIGRLNDGWSAQAPSGFVQEAVLVGANAVKTAPGIVTGDFGNG